MDKLTFDETNTNQEPFEFVSEESLESSDDIYFDRIVNCLQELTLTDQFEESQNAFLKNHMSIFCEGEQNKIQYMQVFKRYQQQFEEFIQKSVHGFKMDKFLELLQSRSHHIDEQILDLLQSFTDFQVFKRLILDFKAYFQNQDSLKCLSVGNSLQISKSY